MSELAEATREAALWALIAKAATERRAAARQRLLKAMQDNGSLKQQEPGLATVTLTGGKPVADVVDHEALVAWTVENRPDQVVPDVRRSWVRLLLKIAEEQGVASDPETGAVVPGIRVVEDPQSLLVRTTPEGESGARYLMQQLALGEASIIMKEQRQIDGPDS